MSDQHESGSPDLTPEQEESVRRLLAGARHEEPVPAEVAARLDRVLADLSSSSSTPSTPPAPVVDLAARRRRRNAGKLLVAAAAVIGGGLVAGQLIGSTSSDDDASSADIAVDREAGADSDGGSASSEQDAPAAGAPDEAAAAKPLQLTSENLERDVQRQLRRSSANADLQPGPSALSQPDGTAFACASAPPETYGTGSFFAAFYDGIPAVLALRPPVGDTQEAEVLDCGTGTPLGSVTVPAP